MTDLLLDRFATTRVSVFVHELEKFPLRDIAEFLLTLPPAQSGMLITHLSSSSIFGLVETMTDSQMASLLVNSEPVHSNVLLAHIPDSKYPAILAAALPEEENNLQDLFGAHNPTTGMLKESRFIRVRPDDPCHKVKEELGKSGLNESFLLVVVDEESRYLGIVPLFLVLRNENAEQPAGVFAVHVPPLAMNASVSSVLSLADWQEHPVLPVVDNANKLIGTVSIRNLLRLENVEQPILNLNADFGFVDAYFGFFADTLDFLLARRSR